MDFVVHPVPSGFLQSEQRKICLNIYLWLVHLKWSYEVTELFHFQNISMKWITLLEQKGTFEHKLLVCLTFT